MTGDACVPVWYKDVTSRPQSESFIGRLTHVSLWVCSSIPSNAAVVPSSVHCSVWYPAVCVRRLWKKKKKTLVGFVFVIKRRGGLRICVLKENESESPALGLFFLQIKACVQRGCEYLTRICSCRSALAVSSFASISVQYTEQHIERYVSGQLAVQVALIRHATSRFKQEE